MDSAAMLLALYAQALPAGAEPDSGVLLAQQVVPAIVGALAVACSVTMLLGGISAYQAGKTARAYGQFVIATIAGTVGVNVLVALSLAFWVIVASNA